MISQVAHTNLVAGDASGLFKALADLGVSDEGLKALERDIEDDKSDGKPTLGQKTLGGSKILENSWAKREPQSASRSPKTPRQNGSCSTMALTSKGGGLAS